MYAIKQRTTAGIYDRSAFSVLIYQIIGKFLETNYLEIFNQIKELNLINENDKFLIILPLEKNYNTILQIMTKRNNGLDDLSIDYVKNQHKVFLEFANFFNFPTVIINHLEPEHSIEKIQNTCIYLFGGVIYSNYPLEKKYSTDAGFDLRVSQNYFIKAGTKQKISFREKIVIPENYVGFLVSRSSVNAVGSIRTGVIDATFSGTLFAIFVADSDNDVQFEEGERVAQLVIVPLHQLPLTVAPILPEIQRKGNSFGSSGKN